VAAFLGVVHIVQADAQDLAGPWHGWQQIQFPKDMHGAGGGTPAFHERAQQIVDRRNGRIVDLVNLIALSQAELDLFALKETDAAHGFS
jgi:hypothetical protein